MENKNFKYTITGVWGNDVLENDLTPTGEFGKTVANEICKLFENFGAKTITHQTLDAADKNIVLPVRAAAARAT